MTTKRTAWRHDSVEAGADRDELAARYGVTRSHINRVARGGNWTARHSAPGSSVFAWRPA